MSYSQHGTLQNTHLSYPQFEHAIQQFEAQTRQHQPWSLIEYRVRKGVPSQYYISRTEAVVGHVQVQSIPIGSIESTAEHVPEINGDGEAAFYDEEDGIEDVKDDAATHQSHAFGEVLSASYHIVYSPSYQVPVLYFNAYKPSGMAISVDEIYTRLVPEAWRSSLRDAGFNGGISQQDHPVLNTPYYYLHPCETASLMETLLTGQQGEGSHNGSLTLSTYIRAWLSMTGQAVGLTIPPEVFLDK